MLDIIAFVPRGDFPRSRLGEKQRGKILVSWVTRKMRTMAQFSIRDGDGPEHRLGEGMETRRLSKTASTLDGSTRNQVPLHENESFDVSQSPSQFQNDFAAGPPGDHHAFPDRFSSLPTEIEGDDPYQSFNPSTAEFVDAEVDPRAELFTGEDDITPIAKTAQLSLHDPLSSDLMHDSSVGDLRPDSQRQDAHQIDYMRPPSNSYAAGQSDNIPAVGVVSPPSPPTREAPGRPEPQFSPRGRDSLPSQQLRHNLDFPSPPQTMAYNEGAPQQRQRTYSFDDWPEEAILYQTQDRK